MLSVLSDGIVQRLDTDLYIQSLICQHHICWALACTECSHLFLQLHLLLPPETRALPYLLQLKLSNLKLENILPGEFSPYQRLTGLDLTDNSFTCIPAAITEISTLRSLTLSGNDSLQLGHGDERIVAALPHLQDLILGTGNQSRHQRWSDVSMRLLVSLTRKFPHLNILISSERSIRTQNILHNANGVWLSRAN